MIAGIVIDMYDIPLSCKKKNPKMYFILSYLRNINKAVAVKGKNRIGGLN